MLTPDPIVRPTLKGASIQIMPLTPGAVPSARHGQVPLAHDLTGSGSGAGRGSLSKTWNV
jgi:hypothetical protein